MRSVPRPGDWLDAFCTSIVTNELISWITLPADPSIVFEKDPLRIWADIMQSLGSRYEMYAQMPPDPSLN